MLRIAAHEENIPVHLIADRDPIEGDRVETKIGIIVPTPEDGTKLYQAFDCLMHDMQLTHLVRQNFYKEIEMENAAADAGLPVTGAQREALEREFEVAQANLNRELSNLTTQWGKTSSLETSVVETEWDQEAFLDSLLEGVSALPPKNTESDEDNEPSMESGAFDEEAFLRELEESSYGNDGASHDDEHHWDYEM